MKGRIMFVLIGLVIFSFVGLLVGTNISGNYDIGFEFLGGVGYEATGYLGAIIGAAIGALLSFLADLKLSNTKK